MRLAKKPWSKSEYNMYFCKRNNEFFDFVIIVIYQTGQNAGRMAVDAK